jgi:hypothetical protein
MNGERYVRQKHLNVESSFNRFFMAPNDYDDRLFASGNAAGKRSVSIVRLGTDGVNALPENSAQPC